MYGSIRLDENSTMIPTYIVVVYFEMNMLLVENISLIKQHFFQFNSVTIIWRWGIKFALE